MIPPWLAATALLTFGVIAWLGDNLQPVWPTAPSHTPLTTEDVRAVSDRLLDGRYEAAAETTRLSADLIGDDPGARSDAGDPIQVTPESRGVPFAVSVLPGCTSIECLILVPAAGRPASPISEL